MGTSSKNPDFSFDQRVTLLVGYLARVHSPGRGAKRTPGSRFLMPSEVFRFMGAHPDEPGASLVADAKWTIYEVPTGFLTADSAEAKRATEAARM